MKTVNIHEAKTNLSRLIKEVQAGRSVMIANAGKPVAVLGPVGSKPKREFGTLKGIYSVPEDIDTAFVNDIEDMFYGTDRAEKTAGKSNK